MRAGSHDDYTVAWICALPLEMAAAKLMLDKTHATLPQPPQDQNTYVLGEINTHKVVIACLPSGIYGLTSAAVVAAQMLSTFREIRLALMVGIGGGVPLASGADIRLGDVVVCKPVGTLSGIVQYDYGKAIAYGQLERTGAQNLPDPALLTAMSHVQAKHMAETPGFLTYLRESLSTVKCSLGEENETFIYPGQDKDILFNSKYQHNGTLSDCGDCDNRQLESRPPRSCTSPRVHYGTIASGNQLIKDARTRDELAKPLGVLCFEMEAAGLMNQLSCLVIRGICDYADSHKNKDWQGYAALTAAAYAKELLSEAPPRTKRHRSTAENTARFDVQFSILNMPKHSFFVGRNQELAEIHEHLRATRFKQTVVLKGLGGIGKTQLAAAYAMRHWQEFSAVFWLDASSAESLGSSVLDMVKRIFDDHPQYGELKEILENENTRAVIKWARAWLARPGNDRWLLIYDNYDHPSSPSFAYDLQPLLPEMLRGHILITTAYPGFEHGHVVHVEKFASYDDSLQVLVAASKREDLTDGKNLLPNASHRLTL